MASRNELLVDTSVAIAFVVEDHEAHDDVFQVLARYRLGLAGHAAFETYSVLTRLPAPARRSPAVVLEVLESNFPATRHLTGTDASATLRSLPELGIAGGSVYDALVAATARSHGLPLATRDRRAASTYAILGVEVELL